MTDPVVVPLDRKGEEHPHRQMARRLGLLADYVVRRNARLHLTQADIDAIVKNVREGEGAIIDLIQEVRVSQRREQDQGERQRQRAAMHLGLPADVTWDALVLVCANRTLQVQAQQEEIASLRLKLKGYEDQSRRDTSDKSQRYLIASTNEPSQG